MRTIQTDKKTYKQYVDAGMWKPEGEFQWAGSHAGKIKAKVQLKKRRGDDELYYDDAEIVIKGYFLPVLR